MSFATVVPRGMSFMRYLEGTAARGAGSHVAQTRLIRLQVSTFEEIGGEKGITYRAGGREFIESVGCGCGGGDGGARGVEWCWRRAG